MKNNNLIDQQDLVISESDESGFYAKDIDYISRIVSYQSPLHMCLVAAIGGYVPPDIQNGFTYCDLACGDGTTVIAYAELYDNAFFVGIDSNSNYISTARNIAKEHDLTNVWFINRDFSNLELNELPDVDFACMNGLYTWLNNKELSYVHEFLKKKLKSGGLFYVQYTSLPGKISVQPMWSLIQYLVPEDSYQDYLDRARIGINLIEDLTKRGTNYLNAHRPVLRAVNSYLSGRKNNQHKDKHFAHNALASGYRPRYFTEMYTEMASIDMLYAGRCEIKLNDIELSVNPAQIPTFQDYIDDIQKVETLKDYIRNEQMRNDIFVKEGKIQKDVANAWIDMNLNLLTRVPSNKIQRFINTMNNNKMPLRGPALEALIEAADDGIVVPNEVAEKNDLSIEKVRKAAVRLLSSNQFFLLTNKPNINVPDPLRISGIEMSGKMNWRILNLACERLTQNELVSNYTGGPAIPISALEAIMLKSVLDIGSFDGASNKAKEYLSQETRTLSTIQGTKKAKEISVEDFKDILKAMRGRKMFNMLRLKIIDPIY